MPVDRATRAASLVVELLDGTRYRVTGGKTPHLVDLAQAIRCDCQDHAFHPGMECAHLLAVQRFRENGHADVPTVTAPLAAPLGPGLERDVSLPDAPDDEHDAPRRLELVRDGPAPFVRSLAQLLTDPDALKPPEAIVPRLGYRGRTTLLFAREKTGKSTLVTAGAAALTRGVDFLGARCGARPVLWVSADQEHANEITQRAVRFGADPAQFYVLWPRAPFADLIATLDGLHPFPGLVVIDTLAPFARTLVSDPSQSAEWPDVLLPLVRVARDLDLAVVIDHHAKKGDGGGYRDSTAIGALVDLLLEVRLDPGAPTRRSITALGRWPVPNFAVELVGDRYELQQAGNLSLDAQILLYVEQHPGSSKRTVRDQVGGRRQDVDDAIKRLLTRGALRNIGSENKHEYMAGPAVPEDPDAPPF